MKVICADFFVFEVWPISFQRKEIGGKAAFKMLVKLTTGRQLTPSLPVPLPDVPCHIPKVKFLTKKFQLVVKKCVFKKIDFSFNPQTIMKLESLRQVSNEFDSTTFEAIKS
jgi:hypothetical protein